MLTEAMNRECAPFAWIDWLLLLAVAGLSVQLAVMLAPPAVEAWHNRPRPGVQVPQQYTDAAGMPVNYLLYLPPGYETGSKWPLVVYLHGAGARGHDLNLVRRDGLPRQIERGKKVDFILLAPQCPAGSGWMPETVVELIEHINNSLSADRDRVYLTGFSMGGNGTWATAAYDPGRFAAIVPLSSGGDVGQADRLVALPIWAFHGAKDEVVPLGASKAMVDAVRKCGGHVEFTVYPNHGHDICDATYQDQLLEWLLAQRRSQASDIKTKPAAERRTAKAARSVQ